MYLICIRGKYALWFNKVVTGYQSTVFDIQLSQMTEMGMALTADLRFEFRSEDQIDQIRKRGCCNEGDKGKPVCHH